MFFDEVHAFHAVLALSDDIHVADMFQQEVELVARELIIVNDDGVQRHDRKYMEGEKTSAILRLAGAYQRGRFYSVAAVSAIDVTRADGVMTFTAHRIQLAIAARTE